MDEAAVRHSDDRAEAQRLPASAHRLHREAGGGDVLARQARIRHRVLRLARPGFRTRHGGGWKRARPHPHPCRDRRRRGIGRCGGADRHVAHQRKEDRRRHRRAISEAEGVGHRVQQDQRRERLADPRHPGARRAARVRHRRARRVRAGRVRPRHRDQHGSGAGGHRDGPVRQHHQDVARRDPQLRLGHRRAGEQLRDDRV